MPTRSRRLLAPLLALLLILTTVGSPVMTERAAARDPGDCLVRTTNLGAAAITGYHIWNQDAYQNIRGAAEDACWPATDQQTVEQLGSTDGYQQALGVQDSVGHFTTVMDNRVAESDVYAWSEAKVTLVNELNNGSSLSIARSEANRSVEEYYAAVEYNLIQDWNTKMNQLRYLDNNGNVSVRLYNENLGSGSEIAPWHNQSYTLVNGSTVHVWYPEDVADDNAMVLADADDNGDSNTPFDKSYLHVEVQDPDGNWVDVISDNGAPGLDGSDYEGLIATIEAQLSNIKSDMSTYSQSVYDGYAAGELNTTDLMSAPELAAQAATQANTTGSNRFAAIELATLGYSGDFNSSFNVSHSASSGYYEGTLFYTADDLTVLEAGQSYNLSTLNGSFVMAVQTSDGDTYTREWSTGTLTIEEMRDVDTGEPVNSTTVDDYTASTTNASALDSEVDGLIELREIYEQELASGGDGIDGGSGDIPLVPLAGVGGVVALVALLNRQSGGNGGGSRRGRGPPR